MTKDDKKKPEPTAEVKKPGPRKNHTDQVADDIMARRLAETGTY